MDTVLVDPPRQLPAPRRPHVHPIFHRRKNCLSRLCPIVLVEGVPEHPEPPPVVRAEEPGQQLPDGREGEVSRDVPHAQPTVNKQQASRRVGEPALHRRSSKYLRVEAPLPDSLLVVPQGFHDVPMSKRFGQQLQLSRVEHHQRLGWRHGAPACHLELLHKPPPRCQEQFIAPGEVACEMLQVEEAEESIRGLRVSRPSLLEGSNGLLPPIEFHQSPAMVYPCLLPHLPRYLLPRPRPGAGASLHGQEGIDRLRPTLEGAERLSQHEMS
mmetsp:Transcript_52586/g.163193  ORF Transcript_52586/g.163193 Transcript_52586/m.163193 type:complete len:269 (+) Transcript_52586:1010-1816(+)